MKSKMCALSVLLLAVAGACSSEAPSGEDGDGDSRCTPGASIECACVDGSRSAQVCADDGTLDPCQCAGRGGTGSGGSATSGGTSAGGTAGTGPSAGTDGGGTGGIGGTATGGQSGTTGLGGSTGLGGTSSTGGSTSGNGGSGAYGNPDSEHIYFEGTVTYESGGYPPLVRQLTVCARCEAEYGSTYTSGRLTFWVSEDTPQWLAYTDMSMTFYPDGIYFRPAEYIEPYDGAYAQDPFGTTQDVPYADSCVHAEDRLIENGGHVTGTLDCTLSRRNVDMPGATMHVVGSFHAEFPSGNPTPP